MALSCLLQAQTWKALFIKMAFFLLLLTKTNSLVFNFTTFTLNVANNNISFEGDAYPASDVLKLTKDSVNNPLNNSTGRASYKDQVQLWDPKTRRLTDFITHFTFTMKRLNISDSNAGDGLAFFLAPFDSQIPQNSSGRYLGLFNSNMSSNATGNSRIVAVEFDSYKNSWDPSSGHVGIDVNSIVSKESVTWRPSTIMTNGSLANAWVSYNSTTHNLSVFLTYADNPVFGGNSSLSHIVDLRDVLPEKVIVGFSASTGASVETHDIHSWSFNSTLEIVNDNGDTKVGLVNEKGDTKVGLIIGLSVGFGVLSCGLGLLWFIFRRKRAARRKEEEEEKYDESIDDEFEKGAGPKRFTYRELSYATNSFAEEGKLGEGGFGGVYKGVLSESNTQVAVKRISRGSKQGRKEYVSEVKIISRLRHRNLLLLVYELMPHGSLDFHLFGGKVMLPWLIRHKIALGLASALLYLHEEWEQCVVHRDIKSSNVMLDSNFNAKLGDFGLARLADHDLGLQTTVLAGTMGYLAPECVTTGKASKESDVYSFGVVALEICCGRRPVERNAEPTKVSLVEWVWDLYGRGQILEAADTKLSREFDEQQMECLMVVGLWCCHPDPSFRPSIKQVVSVLNFEAPLPDLPSGLPKPMYFPTLSNINYLSNTSSGTTSSNIGQVRSTSSSFYTDSSTSENPARPLI
ncbi:hypothetical protein UlMin_028142 [Ulmus minor]